MGGRLRFKKPTTLSEVRAIAGSAAGSTAVGGGEGETEEVPEADGMD